MGAPSSSKLVKDGDISLVSLLWDILRGLLPLPSSRSSFRNRNSVLPSLEGQAATSVRCLECRLPFVHNGEQCQALFVRFVHLRSLSLSLSFLTSSSNLSLSFVALLSTDQAALGHCPFVLAEAATGVSTTSGFAADLQSAGSRSRVWLPALSADPPSCSSRLLLLFLDFSAFLLPAL